MFFDNPAYTWPRGAIIVCITLGLLNTIFLLNRVNLTWSSPTSTPAPITKAEPTLDIPNIVANATLGFESVMVVGLPERSDKRDALSLMAAMTGFKLTWVDGVLGSSISEKAVPAGWDREKLLDSNLGSWRGHVNAIRRAVEEDLSSVLILEDDADWDTHLKSQLADFASAARTLQDHRGQARGESIGDGDDNDDDQNAPLDPDDDLPPTESDDSRSASPYGQHWDLLWLGACITRFSAARDEAMVLLHDDATVARHRHLLQNGSFSWDEYPERTRIAYVPRGDTICTFAYALSRAGARKALLYLGVADQPTTFDFHMSDLCRERHLGMRCVGLVPGLFMHHRPRGRVLGDSDIIDKGKGKGKGKGGDAVRQVGFTENILYSTRLNLQNLVQGLAPEKQWEDG
ncbi:hypothetical protein SLS62_002370 [Diatrype stigma]|uniref:Glycosyltransferase family 25 protein n=1 Tax=Diatrype stigma TaxID=117547 RepID=A0AAN9UYN7_9PEZI